MAGRGSGVLLGTAVAAALIGTARGQSCNMITNGNFASPNHGLEWQYGAPTGWTGAGVPGAGPVSIMNNGANNGQFCAWGCSNSGNGRYHLGLQRTGAFVQQMVSVSLGTRYTITFVAGNRRFHNSNSAKVGVFVNNVAIGEATSLPVGSFSSYSFGFTANVQGQVAFKLTNACGCGTSVDNTVFVDSVMMFVGPNCVNTRSPTRNPTRTPTRRPTRAPTRAPTRVPTRVPTRAPRSRAPTRLPTRAPTRPPTRLPTRAPTTRAPTRLPTRVPTRLPTRAPTRGPTRSPTHPCVGGTHGCSVASTFCAVVGNAGGFTCVCRPGFVSTSAAPSTSCVASRAPTRPPTLSPSTAAPTRPPTAAPTAAPSAAPTTAPTSAPTTAPTSAPTSTPTTAPSASPTAAPTAVPTPAPSAAPSPGPTETPTRGPTVPVLASGGDSGGGGSSAAALIIGAAIVGTCLLVGVAALVARRRKDEQGKPPLKAAATIVNPTYESYTPGSAAPRTATVSGSDGTLYSVPMGAPVAAGPARGGRGDGSITVPGPDGTLYAVPMGAGASAVTVAGSNNTLYAVPLSTDGGAAYDTPQQLGTAVAPAYDNPPGVATSATAPAGYTTPGNLGPLPSGGQSYDRPLDLDPADAGLLRRYDQPLSQPQGVGDASDGERYAQPHSGHGNGGVEALSQTSYHEPTPNAYDSPGSVGAAARGGAGHGPKAASGGEYKQFRGGAEYAMPATDGGYTEPGAVDPHQYAMPDYSSPKGVGPGYLAPAPATARYLAPVAGGHPPRVEYDEPSDGVAYDKAERGQGGAAGGGVAYDNPTASSAYDTAGDGVAYDEATMIGWDGGKAKPAYSAAGYAVLPDQAARGQPHDWDEIC